MAKPDPGLPAPARGTRPRNRRDLILAAAAELFADRGYANVAMGDVARAVNVQPSALYRYFSGKQELLVEVVARGTRLRLEAVQVGVDEGLEPMLTALADSGLASRSSTRLWSVEARNADPAVLTDLRDQVRALPDALARLLRVERPELTEDEAQVVAWAALDVLASISFHDERLPVREFRLELAATMSRIIAAPLPSAGPGWPTPRALEHPARRERLIAEAARLFAARGYGAVRLEDVAAAAGLSTAGLYTYVEGKARLLELVVVRGAEALAHAHVTALEHAEPAGAVDALVETYLRFAWDHPELLTVLLTEVRQLEPPVAAGVQQCLDDVDLVWVSAISGIEPGLDPVRARLRARAAQMVAQDVLATPRLRGGERVLVVVASAMRAALGPA